MWEENTSLPIPWKCSRPNWMKLWEMCSSGNHSVILWNIERRWKIRISKFFRNWERNNLPQTLPITRNVCKDQEGNVHFQTTMAVFKSKTNFSVLWSMPLAQAGWSQVAKAESTNTLRAVVCLQGLSSQSQALLIPVPPSLCLVPLLSPRDTGCTQHGKSLIILLTAVKRILKQGIKLRSPTYLSNFFLNYDE